MFKSFRWRIALWFVGLSSVIYLLLSSFGGWYFYASLSHSLDEELRVVASQIGHAVDLNGAKPTFRDWLRVVQTDPARSIMSIQLFDPSGVMLEHYGPLGIPRLIEQNEVAQGSQRLRVRVTSLLHAGRLVGYLQLQLPTEKRDVSAREFLLTMAVMAPVVLLLFGLCSYLVAGLATKPIEELVATLKRFVVDAGHELNTPASIINARAQSLERKLNKSGILMANEDLISISNAAERMGHIVQDLMLLAEIEGLSGQRRVASVDVSDIVRSVAAELESRFEEKNMALQVGALDAVFVPAEREEIERVLRNLLENSLRYTESAGMVRVELANLGSDALLTVEDSGIGIPEECLPRVFDRFYRVDKSRSRSSGGSGLGLSIVKAIVESLHGRVSVSSQVGAGSKFQISLPTVGARGVAQKLHTNSEDLH